MNFHQVKISDTKEKFEKIKSDKLREECGIFGILNHIDASALVALDCMLCNIEAYKDVVEAFDGKKLSPEKRQGLVGDHFTDNDTLKITRNFAIGHNRYSTTGKTLRNIQPFADLHLGGLVTHNGNLTNALS